MQKTGASDLLAKHWNTEGSVHAGILPQVSKAPKRLSTM